MFMQMVVKVHPACHNILNGIKPGSNSKKTDKHAVDCSKAVFACPTKRTRAYMS